MSDDLQVNSLDRFRKHPGRLVLEQHSGCEVPAGCGGVVLRWRNPMAKVPLIFNFYTLGPAKFHVDGEEIKTHRVDLAPGVHALAVAIQDADLSRELLTAAAVHTPHTDPHGPPATLVEAEFRLLTGVGTGWNCTRDEPEGDAWMQATFDDRHWLPLEEMPDPQLQHEDENYYNWYRCNHFGASCLGLPAHLRGQHPPGARGNVWIRKVFEIPLPQVSTSTSE